MVFQYIALSGYTQLCGIDADAPRDEPVAPPLLKSRVVGIFVEDRAVNGAVVFRPLVLDVDQRPPPPAKPEML